MDDSLKQIIIQESIFPSIDGRFSETKVSKNSFSSMNERIIIQEQLRRAYKAIWILSRFSLSKHEKGREGGN